MLAQPSSGHRPERRAAGRAGSELRPQPPGTAPAPDRKRRRRRRRQPRDSNQQQQQQDPQKPPTYKETVVVSASKTEQQLVDAPATMTVIGARALAVAPSNNYGDLLRSVPGLNITQISARDVNVNSRSATSSLATSQLAVVDGRSIYQDFFGFTMWDFMPSNLDEIKRIEVIRGPASAVWGANALNGVINVITKSPREMPGIERHLRRRHLEPRSQRQRRGQRHDVLRPRHARAGGERSLVLQVLGRHAHAIDAFARPIGADPERRARRIRRTRTTARMQPKFDVRVDYDFADGGTKLQFAGGVGGTDGMMHTGIGPFDIQSGTKFGYWQGELHEEAFRLQAFMNMLDGDANNVAQRRSDRQADRSDCSTPRRSTSRSATPALLGGKHVLTYGGNLRVNHFDLTIAPGEDGRTEGGGYVQDEFMMSSKFRLVAGARVDKFSSIDNAVFSPRVALVIKPKPDQSIRVTYNRAFRAPSMVNNNLNTTVATPLPLGLINPAFGSAIFLRADRRRSAIRTLTEEYVDAFEVAYTGTIRQRAHGVGRVLLHELHRRHLFTQTAVWVQQPPPGFPGAWPVPAGADLGRRLRAPASSFRRRYTYENLGDGEEQGDRARRRRRVHQPVWRVFATTRSRPSRCRCFRA